MTAPEIQLRVDAIQKRVSSGLAKGAPGRPGQLDSSTAFVKTESFRLAIPRRGHVLSTVAEIYGDPIREAVSALSGSLMRKPHTDICKALRLLISSNMSSETHRANAERVAWSVVSIWITGVATKALSVSASLTQAEQWFFGDSAMHGLTKLLSELAIKRAEIALRAKTDASAYFELLPYILDPHGPGSRLSVRRDPATRTARSRKRTYGIFYTPADVADYMVGACLDTLNANTLPTIFDPACGTGVFLRSALSELRRRHPKRNAISLISDCLFGADIDPWSLDAAAFVLLADTRIDPTNQDTAPVVTWQRIRMNLARIDTLLIDPVENEPRISRRCRDSNGRVSISRLFPTLKRRPTIFLGNPPYADLGARSDCSDLGHIFQTIAAKSRPNAEIYLAFIEQMIRLTDNETCAGALVLPLSIACNIGPQFMAARKLIGETRGKWRFAFFDREPHALFGEDVKTRNAIILWSRGSLDDSAVLATGPLSKWRGDSRAVMFRSLRFTEINTNISAGIPKIDGDRQVSALKMLGTQQNRLAQAVQSIGRLSLAATPDADDKTIFIGPTAYNFLNVFLRPPRALLGSCQTLSEHPLHFIRCSSRQDALAVFAIFSSNLVYWWWHVHGDGFHVSSRLISELPFGIDALSRQTAAILSRCGAELWSAIKSNPIISHNRGRTSLAYTPNGCENVRRRIDETLAKCAGLELEIVDEVERFTARTVSARLSFHAIRGIDDKEWI